MFRLRLITTLLLTLLCLALVACSDDDSPPPAADASPTYVDFTDSFDGPFLNGAYWANPALFTRDAAGNVLDYRLAGAGQTVDNSIGLSITSTATHSADVTVTSLATTGTVNARARVAGRYYHTTHPDEQLGSRVGDVNAELGLWGDAVYYLVWRCLAESCDSLETVELLSDDAGNPFVQVLSGLALNTPVNLSVDWDNATADQFTFTANDGTPTVVTFDPATAGYPNTNLAANAEARWIGLRQSGMDSGENADMSATFDNVTVSGGTPWDNFDGLTHLQLGEWSEADGKIDIFGGTLVTEAGAEFSGTLPRDERGTFTVLSTPAGAAYSVPRITSAVQLSSATITDAAGGTTPQGRAGVELRYSDPDEVTLLNTFFVRAQLQASGATPTYSAVVSAFSCADTSCSTAYPGGQDFQTFTTSVTSGPIYTLSVEYVGNGRFEASIGSETLTVDFSDVPQFDPDNQELTARLTTRARRVSDSGDAAFIRAVYDDVTVGAP